MVRVLRARHSIDEHTRHHIRTFEQELRLPDVSDALAPGSRLVRRALGIILFVFAAAVVTGIIGSFLVTMNVTVDATGQLEPSTVVPVRARVTGTIVSVDVESGTLVQKGQVVARLDSLSVATTGANRPSPYQESVKSYMNVVAPITGVVLTDSLQRLNGSTARRGEQLMTIADLNRWQATLLVREQSIHDVRRGDRASIEVPALKTLHGGRLGGRVSSVAASPVINPGTASGSGVFRVVVKLDQQQVDAVGADQFRPGYTVRAKIVTRSDRIAILLRDYVGARLRAAQSQS